MKLDRNKSLEEKRIPAMILKIATGYINKGETVKEKEKYLHSACTAWNLACMSDKRREKELKRYIKTYKKINNADKEACKALKEDMISLIKRKNELYPDVINIKVTNSTIVSIGGQDHVIITSTETI